MPLINNINNLLRLVGFRSFCLICFIKCRQSDAICWVQWFFSIPLINNIDSLLQIVGFSGFVYVPLIKIDSFKLIIRIW